MIGTFAASMISSRLYLFWMPRPEPIGRSQGHHRDATDLLQLARDNRVITGVHHDLKAIRDQCFSGTQCLQHVREQCLLITKNFQFHQVVTIQQFARQTTGAHRIFRAVAAGGVGQQGVAIWGQHVQQVWFIRVLADIGSTNRHGDDLRTRRFGRQTGFLEIAELAGACQQAGLKGALTNAQQVGRSRVVFMR
jgi:hypothetical protein